jgi:hypothetical protein
VVQGKVKNERKLEHGFFYPVADIKFDVIEYIIIRMGIKIFKIKLHLLLGLLDLLSPEEELAKVL